MTSSTSVKAAKWIHWSEVFNLLTSYSDKTKQNSKKLTVLWLIHCACSCVFWTFRANILHFCKDTSKYDSSYWRSVSNNATNVFLKSQSIGCWLRGTMNFEGSFFHNILVKAFAHLWKITFEINSSVSVPIKRNILNAIVLDLLHFVRTSSKKSSIT